MGVGDFALNIESFRCLKLDSQLKLSELRLKRVYKKFIKFFIYINS